MDYTREVFENNTIVDAARVLNKFDAALYEIAANADGGEYVWTNPSPSASYGSDVVIITYTKKPKFYEIEFTAINSAPNVRFTTGKISTAYSTQLQVLQASTMRYRDVTVEFDEESSGIFFTFSTGKYSSSSTSANYAIPQRIKLYY